jgi:hypothetical protein
MLRGNTLCGVLSLSVHTHAHTLLAARAAPDQAPESEQLEASNAEDLTSARPLRNGN